MKNKRDENKKSFKYNFFPRNNKGQDLSTGAIILIILGVIVLILLALGFTIGWQKILPWISSSNNVDTIVNQCQVACTTSDTYGFCTQTRTLKATDLPSADGTVQKEVTNTCKFFSTDTNYLKYSIGQCPGLCS